MSLKKKYVFSILIIVFFALVFAPVTFLAYDMTMGELLRNSVFALMYVCGLIYIFIYSKLSHKLEYDNLEHPLRFAITFAVGVVFSAVFPLIDVKGWFFLCIAVSFALFSNGLTAVYSISGLIMFSMLCSPENGIITFFVYFLSSMAGILLFQDVDENFNIGFSYSVSSLFLLVIETAGLVLLQNEDFNAEQFVMPVVNILVNGIVLFFVLKFFNESVANRYRNKYLELNDQEYSALQKLKEVSSEEYFRSIHTAYLAERMALSMGCKAYLAKNCAYYHRIKQAMGLSMEECRTFVDENGFPPEAKETLLNFLDKSEPLITREAGVVYLSDKLISSLMTLFAKDKKAQINYEELIDTLFKREILKDTLSESLLTQHDFKVIKEVFLKENLYYDFLR